MRLIQVGKTIRILDASGNMSLVLWSWEVGVVVCL